jgi:hypothetical protein
VIVTEWSTPMMAARTDLGNFVGWMVEMGFAFWRITAGSQLEPVSAAALPGLPHGEVLMARAAPGALAR